MKVYIAVCEDRHVDDEISVFATLCAAKQHANDFMDSYADQYDALEVTYHKLDADGNGWVCDYRTECDEGPKARVEVAELQGAVALMGDQE
jgi:hypothetical protein